MRAAILSGQESPGGAATILRLQRAGAAGKLGEGPEGAPGESASEGPEGTPREGRGTPRVPVPPVISAYETDVAGRPSLHGAPRAHARTQQGPCVQGPCCTGQWPLPVPRKRLAACAVRRGPSRDAWRVRLPAQLRARRAEAILHRWWQPSTLMEAAGRPGALCGKPPVPFRRVVNVRTADGAMVTVNAQPYVVLAFDVPPPRKAARCGAAHGCALPGSVRPAMRRAGPAGCSRAAVAACGRALGKPRRRGPARLCLQARAGSQALTRLCLPRACIF